MKKIFIVSYCSFLITGLVLPGHSFSQNIGMGTSTPHASAVLEIQSTNKGMLVPRIALTAVNSASPVTSPADALLVYNTATAGAGTNAVEPGFYYWKASTNRWTALNESVSNQSLGFGTWGDCSTSGVSEFNPVADETGAAGDRFGSKVSISGNYAITGASLDDIGVNADQGSASIYQHNGSNWVLMQKITDATGAAGDNFGSAVSISGNYAIVGAYLDDVGANTDQGSASIYRYNGSTWVLMQKITDATGAPGDAFGISVSISGNYAITGSAGDDVGAVLNQGSASVYQYNGTNWILMNKITDASGAADDFFGATVSISNNYVIVGSYLDDVGANTDQGSASFYQYNGSNWVFMQKQPDATGAANDNFGLSVSISGNYAIVGAWLDDGVGGLRQGSASIYQYNGTNWVLMNKLTDAAGAAYDYFGSAVCISGNYAIVGAQQDDVAPGIDQGSAAIYQRVGLGWVKLQFTSDPSGSALDTFGFATAIDGTTKRFLIGSPGYSGSSGKAIFGKIN